MRAAMSAIALVIYLALGAAVWWITRGLRKSWYPRFTVGITGAALLCLIGSLGALGAWYQSETVNRGEAD